MVPLALWLGVKTRWVKTPAVKQHGMLQPRLENITSYTDVVCFLWDLVSSCEFSVSHSLMFQGIHCAVFECLHALCTRWSMSLSSVTCSAFCDSSGHREP
mmetsp:Transcript_68168/g.129756  ORF Transcript_68168/g.129756 Transcript_68168/m.129756 type:complete len:100 (-) Transcript_68168:107-406(-)